MSARLVSAGQMGHCRLLLLMSCLVRCFDQSRKGRSNHLAHGVPVQVSQWSYQDTIRSQVPPDPSNTAEGGHWSQYGAQPAGPVLMLMVHQALVRLRPSLAYHSLDGENAYGTIKRSAMLQDTTQHAAFLACQWSAPNRAWAEQGVQCWKKFL